MHPGPCEGNHPGLVQMLTIECSQYVTLFYSALETITHRNGLHMAVLIWNDRVKTAQRYTNSKYIVNTIQPLFFTAGLEMIRYFIEYHKTKHTTYGTSWPLNCFPISFGYFEKNHSGTSTGNFDDIFLCTSSDMLMNVTVLRNQHVQYIADVNLL